MEITAHNPGSFCTAVLRTTDVERATDFYNAVVGWTTQQASDSPGWRHFLWRDKPVASLQLIDEGSDIWVPHVSVEKVDSVVAQAEALGAKLVDRTDVPHVARLATLCDPEGSTFGLWQPSPDQGAQLMEDVGSLWWIEVLSNDAPRAREFYNRLFGWNHIETSFEPFASYTVFKRGDVQEGGLLPIGPDWGVAPRWSAIFSVDDCDATIERAKLLGGSPIFVHTVPRAGRIGSLSDSGRAVFVIRGPVPGSTK